MIIEENRIEWKKVKRDYHIEESYWEYEVREFGRERGTGQWSPGNSMLISMTTHLTEAEQNHPLSLGCCIMWPCQGSPSDLLQSFSFLSIRTLKVSSWFLFTEGKSRQGLKSWIHWAGNQVMVVWGGLLRMCWALSLHPWSTLAPELRLS